MHILSGSEKILVKVNFFSKDDIHLHIQVPPSVNQNQAASIEAAATGKLMLLLLPTESNLPVAVDPVLPVGFLIGDFF